MSEFISQSCDKPVVTICFARAWRTGVELMIELETDVKVVDDLIVQVDITIKANATFL